MKRHVMSCEHCGAPIVDTVHPAGRWIRTPPSARSAAGG